jgi:putative membrane protein
MTPARDYLIRPSMKGVWAAYLLAFIVFAAGVWAYYRYAEDEPAWLMALPLVAFLAPLRMHLRRRTISMRLHDDHLTIESGFLSRTRRTVDMAKIQDVTVSQTLGQRLMGVGDLRLESAGESGAMGIVNVDGPRKIADMILATANRLHSARGSGSV